MTLGQLMRAFERRAVWDIPEAARYVRWWARFAQERPQDCRTLCS